METSLFIHLNNLKASQHPHTASHSHSALRLAALSTPFLAPRVLLRAPVSLRCLSVAMAMDKTCVLYSLSTEERKCDLMLCPDSPSACLEKCDYVAI